MKLINLSRKYGARLAAGAGALVAPVFAFASAGTYDAITDAVDFGDVTTAVVAVAALVAAVLVVIRGTKFMLGAVRR